MKWNKDQEKTVRESYDWIARVVQKQGRFIDFSTLWSSYPFKRHGMTRKGLSLLYESMQEALKC